MSKMYRKLDSKSLFISYATGDLAYWKVANTS